MGDRQPRTSKELDLRKLAQTFTRQALATTVVIMRDKENPPHVRLAAAELVMKRGHGNSVQPLSNPDGSALSFNTMSDEEIRNAILRLDAGLGQSAESASSTHRGTSTAH